MRTGRPKAELRLSAEEQAQLSGLAVSDQMEHDENDLLDMLSKVRSRMGRLFHTDVLTERSLKQLFRQAPGRLLIVGKKFADEVHLPLDEAPGSGRCVIVVQGPKQILAARSLLKISARANDDATFSFALRAAAAVSSMRFVHS
jgi:hypothetical protein